MSENLFFCTHLVCYGDEQTNNLPGGMYQGSACFRVGTGERADWEIRNQSKKGRFSTKKKDGKESAGLREKSLLQ